MPVMVAILLELQNTEAVQAEHHGSGNFKLDPQAVWDHFLPVMVSSENRYQEGWSYARDQLKLSLVE